MKSKLCVNTLVALVVASFIAPLSQPAEAHGGRGGYGGGRSYGGGGYARAAAPARSYAYSTRPSFNYSQRPVYSHNVYNYNVYGTNTWHNRAAAGIYGTRVWNGSRYTGRVAPIRIYNNVSTYYGPGVYNGYFWNNGGYYGVPYSSWSSGCRAGWYGGRYWYGNRWADVAALSVLAGLELYGVMDHGIGYYPYSNWNYASPSGIYDNCYWTGSGWYGAGNSWYAGCPEGWYGGRYWRADGRWATAQEIALLIAMLLQ